MMRIAAGLSGSLLLLAAGQAAAHPRFVSASPGRGATIATPPSEIRVTFSEPVLAQGSSFRLTDAEGRPIRTGALARAKDGKTLVLPIQARLGPGGYVVQWQVLEEGHSTVPGRYRFELKP